MVPPTVVESHMSLPFFLPHACVTFSFPFLFFFAALSLAHLPNSPLYNPLYCRLPLIFLTTLFLLHFQPPPATMIKTLSPYSGGAPSAATTTSKTAEIMSRYRPIAPKPEIPAVTGDQSPSSSPTSSLSQKIQQSPYLRNLWPQLQARPTRTRKRGRTAISLPAVKRQRPNHPHAPPPPSPFHAFTHLSLPISASPENIVAATTSPRSLVTLPLLPCPTSEVDVNLNLGNSRSCHVAEIPEEKDLLQQLNQKTSAAATTATVISPRPIRPVGSSISVGSITENLTSPITTVQTTVMKPEEVEEEVESEALPAVISDSNHKVRLANSAYKEMVGQPECSWLDSMVVGPCRRISGEVVLRISGGQKVPVLSDKFSCWVRIEWGNQGKKKNAVDAFCDVKRLACESKDYVLSWRFHINTRPAAAQPSCV